MRGLRLLFAIMIMLSSFPAKPIAAPSQSRPIAIIAAKQSNIKQLSRGKLKLIYLRKQRYWPKGVPIKPVNLQSSNPLREQFSQVVIGSTPSAQINYWNGQYFNGILPPYVVNSEEAVIRYVTQTKGAVGYIDACQLDKRVKAIAWVMNHSVYTSKPDQLNCH